MATGVSDYFQAHGVMVSYDGIVAVDSVSLTVAQGQIVAVVGANGAGKTSLLNAIMGVVSSSGSVTFESARLDNLSVEARASQGIRLVPEKRELFPTMSVEDNLLLGGFHHRQGRAGRQAKLSEVFSLFPRLKERRRQLAATLSGGERQMLAMGRALMGEPRLLMLDEPSLGLAPIVVRDVFAIIKNMRASGIGVLLVEQNARASLQVADYGYVMERGRVVMEGEAERLRSDGKVIESYLGVAATFSCAELSARQAGD
jgi:branched-chain amino acid transport system ATP-binding protein